MGSEDGENIETCIKNWCKQRCQLLKFHHAKPGQHSKMQIELAIH